ncbi:hypothetical protein GMORB2_6306 [Geosmithia morbida]|uniref:2EXR domain-containing protein n=1 Tax=Geosmithia morbida TaxID=1094350 RepID=A0A9P5D5B1_9HYPO|nr:uncharacterized protein GMORB2_6306 [Geosmithia morbida]KAF4123605.1 hypothetical protein GMORB2_6306 [Geosmithia morbida]
MAEADHAARTDEANTGRAEDEDEQIQQQYYEEEPQSDNPKFWLEFRTFDDGMNTSTSPSSPDDAAEFPQFCRLPPELRLKVWEYLVQPRVVVACCLHRGEDDDPNAGESLASRRRELDGRTTGGNAVPSLLHVNRESRAVGRRHYELTFAWRVSKLLSDTPTSRPPRVYFNFQLDTLLLTGELEPYDSYGINSTMVYFLRREDTFRVRHVACAFRELGYPDQESDQVFGCLWHVVDRFPAADTLLVTLVAGDEDKIGHQEAARVLDRNNVVQKIWSSWMSGTAVTGSRMADKHMLLVQEEKLLDYVVSRQEP